MEFITGILTSRLPDFAIIVLALIILIINNRKIEKQLEKFEYKIEKLEERLEQISVDFVSKEQHYQDVSGWRGEIRKVEDRIERLADKIIEIVKIMEVKK